MNIGHGLQLPTTSQLNGLEQNDTVQKGIKSEIIHFISNNFCFESFPKQCFWGMLLVHPKTHFPPEGEWLRRWKIQGDYYGLEFCLQQLLFREFSQKVLLRYATRINQTTFPPWRESGYAPGKARVTIMG